jgi:phage shock protein A
MKLKHINYIHNLLWNEEYKARWVYEAALSELQEAVEIDSSQAAELEDMVGELRQRWEEAKEALDAFEAREW